MPARLGERPLRASHVARDAIIGGTQADLDTRLILPAVINALKIPVEKTPLQRNAVGRQERQEIRAALHLEPFVARADALITLDGAAQVQAKAAVIGHHQRRQRDVLKLRAARTVPVVIKSMGEDVARIINAVGSKLPGCERCGRGGALAGVDVLERTLRIAVLVAQHAARPPAPNEAAGEHAALAHAVAVKIRGALPGQDGGKMRRTHRGDHPLPGGVIRNAEQTDLAAGPRLHAGPADSIVEILEFGGRVRIQPPGRFARAARINFDDDVAVTNPDLGIGRLKDQIFTRRSGENFRVPLTQRRPGLGHELG